jgi:hypothetical protein
MDDEHFSAYGINNMTGINATLVNSLIASQGRAKGNQFTTMLQVSDRKFVRETMSRLASSFITEVTGNRQISPSIIRLDETASCEIAILSSADFCLLAASSKPIHLMVVRDLAAADRADPVLVQDQSEWVYSNSFDRLSEHFRGAFSASVLGTLLIKARTRSPALGEYHRLDADQILVELAAAFADKTMGAHVKDIIDAISELILLHKSKDGYSGLSYFARVTKILAGFRTLCEIKQQEAFALALLVAVSGNDQIEYTLAHVNNLSLNQFNASDERVALHEQVLAIDISSKSRRLRQGLADSVPVPTKPARKASAVVPHLAHVASPVKKALPGALPSRVGKGKVCGHCRKLGHDESTCWIKFPERRPDQVPIAKYSQPFSSKRTTRLAVQSHKRVGFAAMGAVPLPASSFRKERASADGSIKSVGEESNLDCDFENEL